MIITYTWKITGLRVQDFDSSKPNSVVQTYWQKIGTDENGYEGIFSGATPFTPDPSDASGPFIPFEQLTEEDVLAWIKTVVVDLYEQHVNEQIQKAITEKYKPITETPLPWAPVVETTLPKP